MCFLTYGTNLYNIIVRLDVRIMLNSVLRLFSAVLLVLASSTFAGAQSPSGALSEAKTRLVCGTSTLVSAQYLPGGSLEVTCRQNTSNDSIPNEMQGTGLTTDTILGVTAVLVVLAVLAGDSDTGATTTTTGQNGE